MVFDSCEAALVGSLFINPEQLEDEPVLSVRPDDFEDEVLGQVFGEILHRHHAGEAIDPVLILSDFKEQRDWTTIVQCGSKVNALEYAKRILDDSSRRKYRTQLYAMSQEICDDMSPATIQEEIRKLLSVETRTEDVSITSALKALQEYQKLSASGKTVLPTGYKKLDELIGGFSPGRLYILAGRPATGKTTLAFNMLLHISVPTLLVSLELSQHETVGKLIGIQNRRPLADVLSRPEPEEGQFLNEMKLRISSFSKTLDDIHSLLNAEDRLLVIDQFSFLKIPGFKGGPFEEYAEIVHGLKNMARDRQVPVMLLAQLNRDKAKREDPPKLSDLKNTGALEEDADVVFLLDSEEALPTELKHTLSVNVAKNRQGPTGIVKFDFYGRTGVIS